MIVPITVLAKEGPYISYSNIKADGNDLMGWGSSGDDFFFSMNDAKEYEFTLKGYNLDEDKEYVFSLFSDFIDYKKTYTGKQLMDGVDISRNDGDSIIISKVYSVEEKEYINTKFNDNYYPNVSFYFNSNFDDTLLDNYYNKIVKKGALNINSIIPDDKLYYESAISASLRDYLEEPFSIYGYCDEDNKCYMSISDTRFSNHYKSYEVKYTFVKTDKEIKEKVDKYIKKFPVIGDDFDENRLFTLDDLENINYRYALIQYGKDRDEAMLNSGINYSSEIQELLEYGNLTAIMDTRAGWDDDFTNGGFGFLNLKYNDTIYGFIDGAGIKQNNVIYVSDDTEDSRSAYIEAAKKRIEEYLPNVKVSIKYEGQISDLDDEYWIIKINDIVDVEKTLGEYYTISLDNNIFHFFIAKDSKRMKNPQMNTTDLKTNIKINTNSSAVPLDSKIKAIVYNSDSDEYKETIKKLNIKNAKVIDLKLYSNSTDEYIVKLDNGKFMVYVPISEEEEDKTLMAYYIRDDGTIEEHEVTIKDGYAIFETDHFSTYTIGEKEDTIKNPQTFDNIVSWIMLLVISITGITLFKPSTIKKN